MSVVVSIAAHYVPNRVLYTARVLDLMEDWPIDDVSVTLVTNDLALADEPVLRESIEKLKNRGYTVDFDKTYDLAHPFHLTWWHKKHLKNWFEAGGEPDDLFIYIEDDIGISRENISYFTDALPRLKKFGLIPGFMRYERFEGKIMSTDFRGPDIIEDTRRVTVDGQDYVNPKFPYWAGFVMDRELCAEYLASPSFLMYEAAKKPQAERHTCRVLSAWGLTFENVPQHFLSRYVVPVDKLTPDPKCFVWHTAENYSRSKYLSFGTMELQDVFLAPSLKSSARYKMWQSKAFLRRVKDKIGRMSRGEKPQPPNTGL